MFGFRQDLSLRRRRRDSKPRARQRLDTRYRSRTMLKRPLLHLLQKPRTEAFSHECPFHRRKFEKRADEGPHEFVIDPPGFVEELVLERSPLERLEHDPLEGGLRVQNAAPSFPQTQ